mmetsp:Transcript_14591/g.41702  ORF Transcript_14591/g.41702 Transcript_14591/m.41702 type:complete len:328 (+) Transcript_14591:398-1381(+)
MSPLRARSVSQSTCEHSTMLPWRRISLTSLPSWRSQTLRVQSAPPLRTTLDIQFALRHRTQLPCPWSSWRQSPDPMSVSLMRPSLPALRAWCPCQNTARHSTLRACALKTRHVPFEHLAWPQFMSQSCRLPASSPARHCRDAQFATTQKMSLENSPSCCAGSSAPLHSTPGAPNLQTQSPAPRSHTLSPSCPPLRAWFRPQLTATQLTDPMPSSAYARERPCSRSQQTRPPPPPTKANGPAETFRVSRIGVLLTTRSRSLQVSSRILLVLSSIRTWRLAGTSWAPCTACLTARTPASGGKALFSTVSSSSFTTTTVTLQQAATIRAV